jgi:hypothetical protein
MLIMTLKNYRFIFLFLIISMLTPNAFALDLSSTITSSSNRLQTGASVIYTGTVINKSTTSATNSQLIFYMPPRNVNYISLPVGCTLKVKITCLLGDLVGGASVSKSITVSYSNSGAAVVSALAVTESADSNINNNASRLTTNVAKSGANSVTIPSISSVNPIPVSATMGNSINFSASLSGNLPSGYSVKLNYSNSSISMSGSGTSFSAVQAPTQIGQQVFSIGIYDANNILKSNTLTGNFEIVKANSVATLSFISGNSTATTGTGYSVQLQASDADNNLQSISVVWGDGATDTQNATNGTTLTFTHTYSTANTYNWSATALDSGNASSIAIAKSVTVSAAVVTPPPSTLAYTKISNTGTTLPDTAVLGSGLNDWTCLKDNKTGMIWEIKTNDGGLRDLNNTYTNYFVDDTGYGLSNNADVFVNAVNTQTLCGSAKWRMPTIEELRSLVYCSDGRYETKFEIYGCVYSYSTSFIKPTINKKYFPDTLLGDIFWSSTPVTYSNGLVWNVSFNSGHSSDGNKYRNNKVRLILPTSDYTKISNTGKILPDTAVLGSGSNDWACTKDNRTGLIWEVKTDDGGLRDKDWQYSWYEPDPIINGGFAGYQNGNGHPEWCSGSYCDTYAYKNAVNKKTLCGVDNWRLPTKDELMKLIVCSDEKYAADDSCTNYGSVSQPTINTMYFQNTRSYGYWSSSSHTYFVHNAWYANFISGSYTDFDKSNGYFIRLVR